MNPEVTVAILSLAGTLMGSVVGILTANKLVVYRIEQLEQAVRKHNNVVERVALLEQDNGTQWKRIDELKSNIEELREGR